MAIDERVTLVVGESRAQRRYAAMLSITDLVVVALATFAAQLIRFGITPMPVPVPELPPVDRVFNYTAVSVLLVLGWALSLRVFGARHPDVIGSGLIEYNRVSAATFALVALVAMVGFASQAEIDRAYLLVGFALGWALLLLSRWLWRRWLLRR